MKIISKIAVFIKAINKLGFREVYHIITSFTNELPKLAKSENNDIVFTGIKNDYLFQSASSSGINEEHFVQIANALIKESDNVIDLGANIGTHTILMSKIVTKGSVTSFEPQSLTYSILQNNIMLNKCNNVVSYRFAISDVDDVIISMERFSYNGNTDQINNGSLRISSMTNFVGGDLSITKKLDSLIIPKVSFIKIDIQGSEVKALKGAKELLKRDKPIIFIEIEELHLKC